MPYLCNLALRAGRHTQSAARVFFFASMSSPPLVGLHPDNLVERPRQRARHDDDATTTGAAAVSEFMQTADMLVQLAEALVESVVKDGSAEGAEGVRGGEHVDLCERIAAICSTSKEGLCPDDVYRVALAFFGVIPRSDTNLGPYGKRTEGDRWRPLFFDLCSAFHKDWVAWSHMGFAADADANPNIGSASVLSVQLRDRPLEHPDRLRTLVAQSGPAAARDRSAWYDALAFAWHAYQEMLDSYLRGHRGLRGLVKSDFDTIVSELVDEEEDSAKRRGVAAVLARVDREPEAPDLADEALMRLARVRRGALRRVAEIDDNWGAKAHEIIEEAILNEEGPFAALWLLLEFTGAKRRTAYEGYYNADSQLLDEVFEQFFESDGESIEAKYVDLSENEAEPYLSIDRLLDQEGADPYGAPVLLPLTEDPTTAFSTLPELAMRTGNGTLVARLFSSASSPKLQGPALKDMRRRPETWAAISAGFRASYELYGEDERAKYNKAVLALIEAVTQAEEEAADVYSYSGELNALVADVEARPPNNDASHVALKVALSLLATRAGIIDEIAQLTAMELAALDFP